jgi:TonB family protein
MLGKEDPMYRPLMILFLTILFSVRLAAQQRADVTQWVDIAPVVAASHLLKKVAPIYPTFAKAAGIEGVVRVGIHIDPDGHVQLIPVLSGSPLLFEAAEKAVGQYVYKPFEKDGKAIGVETTVDVAFVIPNHQNIFHPQPPPELTLDSFRDSDGFMPTEHLSAKMRDWLSSYWLKMMDDPGCADVASRPFPLTHPPKDSSPKAIVELLAESIALEIQTDNAASRVYVVQPSCGCSPTGNCPIELVEDRAGQVHLIADAGGWGLYIYPRQGRPYPDIFVVSHMSATEADVAGYSNVEGQWGPLYCGKITIDDNGQEKSDVDVCR